MVLRVDARGLAALAADAAVDALGGVDCGAEDGEAGDEAQDGADGADVVAPGAAAAPGQDPNNYIMSARFGLPASTGSTYRHFFFSSRLSQASATSENTASSATGPW